MRLYVEQKKKIAELLSVLPHESKPFNEADCAPSTEKSQILFRNETAFELGGMGLQSVCSVFFSEAASVDDCVNVYGKDLCELTEDSPFAQIVEVGLYTGEEGELDCEALKDIEFSVYRLALADYCVQIAPFSERMQVRVGKNAQKKGLSFYNIGCTYIKEFKKNPFVKKVSVTFVTEPSFDYKEMHTVAKKVKKITQAVTSRFGEQTLDCASCSMKALCDEVEGLRELHFKNKTSENSKEK